jgi:membrane-associated phospholipid phosphatase
MIQKTRPFLLLFLVFLVAGAWLLATFSKADLLLAVNQHYYAFGDAVLPYWTDWGDGITHIALIGVLIVYARRRYGVSEAWRYGWLGFLTFAIPSLISQFLKSEFFNKEPRPVTYFAQTPSVLHHVDGVHLWTYNSFPSGHTITAFSIALLLLYLPVRGHRWGWSLLLFVWACSVGYSRMYLGEHFFKDVYGGAIIGVVATLGALWLGERSIPTWGKRPAS